MFNKNTEAAHSKSKTRAPRNKTLNILDNEASALLDRTLTISHHVSPDEIAGNIIFQDIFTCVDFLPDAFIDLLIVDPPYNLNKTFSTTKFSKSSSSDYEQWLESWIAKVIRCLKPNASIYVCCDWKSSNSAQAVLERHFIVRNRITWEREKGRGANANWKNCSEDIWFCTMSNDYFFNVEAVKLKKKVIAPYRDKLGAPKDWEKTKGHA